MTTNEEVIHRVRNPRHIGRDGLVRPSIAHETLGNYIFDVCRVLRKYRQNYLSSFRNSVKNMKDILHILIQY